jgi:UDP:flavonoid glycosyltransferase YjiC (YdhE family)
MLGVHSVHHGFGRRVPAVCFEQAAKEMDLVWAAHGLAPAPLCGAFRGDYIDICPPSIRPAAVDDGVPVFEMRVSPEIGTKPQQPWRTRLTTGRTVYVTLGTMFNDLRVFRVLLDGLSRVDCAVVATVGRDNDPERLEPVPANMIVERFIPQDEVLPHIAATVCHGGSGSTLAALAHGVPMLMLPQAADQFENAQVCQEIGAALALMPDEVTPDSVGSAVTALLDDPKYSANARRIAAEISRMQSPAAVLALLVNRLEQPHLN